MTVDLTHAHTVATAVAVNEALNYVTKHYDGEDAGACGFAWVTFHPKNKGNTKLGKAERKMFEAIGFSKDWTGKAWQLWNPANYRGQNIDTKYTGAVAYAKKFEELTGIKLSAADRLD